MTGPRVTGQASPPTNLAPPVHGRREAARILIAACGLYLSYGMMAGLAQGGLPPVLRAAGFGIAASAWILALYLPFGLAFLWAPALDRWSLPWLSPRVGWIVAMQGLVVMGLLAIGLGATLPAPVLLALAVGISVAAATMDVSLDALTVEVVPAGLRPAAAATKLASLALGAILGGGVFIGLFAHIGWLGTFSALAGVAALVTLPSVLLPAIDRKVDRAGRAAPSLFALFHRPGMVRRLLTLCAISSATFAFTGLNRIMLVDLGVPLERIGWTVGVLAPIGMLAASAMAAALMRRWGGGAAVIAFTALCLLAAVALLAGFVLQHEGIAITGAVLAGTGGSGIFVVFAALLLGWAAGPQPATDYTTLFGIARLVSTLAAIVAGQAVAVMGWTAFYIVMPLLLLGVVLAARAGRDDRLLRDPPSP